MQATDLDIDELQAWLRFTITPGIGPVTARALLKEFGLPQTVFDAGHGAISRVAGEAVARALATPPPELDALLDRTNAWLALGNRRLLTLADAQYPAQLLTIADPPLLLYAIGDLALLDRDGVAIVGSRNATASGLAHAKSFAGTLANGGLSVISGLALGIDAAAHEGALDSGGATIAVIGTGADIVYPARNKSLAHAIAERGLILAEQALGTSALPHQFPQRNRIISGLSRAVLVVEAAAQSGSLITARLASEQGRDVFAIPGSIHSPLSKGCHQLIKQGAKLIDDARDIFEEFAMPAQAPAARPARPAKSTNQDNEPPWLVAAGWDPFSVDELIQRTGASAAALNNALLDWELDGRIAKLAGGRFQRLGQ